MIINYIFEVGGWTRAKYYITMEMDKYNLEIYREIQIIFIHRGGIKIILNKYLIFIVWLEYGKYRI